MKRNLSQIAIMALMVAVASSGLSFGTKVDFFFFRVDDEAMCYNVPNKTDIKKGDDVEIARYQLFLDKSYIAFKEALAFKESQGDYSTINSYGYLGKYQFNKNTLKMIGIHDSSDFMNDTRLQEDAFNAYTARNKWILRRDIKRYVGTYINGVRVTESGILAAAHLAGAGNVKKYLRSGGTEEFEDAFGTSIRYYLKKFSGYDTSLIEPQKQIDLL